MYSGADGKLGITTLITLHDLNLATAYCNHLYVLSDGQIVALGDPQATLTRELIQQVFRVDAVSMRHSVTQKLHLVFVPLR